MAVDVSREARLQAAIDQIAANRVALEGPAPMVADSSYTRDTRPPEKRRYKPEDGIRKRDQRARDPVAAARHAARKAVAREVAAGRMMPGACRECGGRPTEAHHYDHDRPLVVIWLCKAHHDAITFAAGAKPRDRRRGW